MIGDGLDEPAANVVLALGRRGAPRQLGVPGEDLAKVSYRMIEPAAFAGRRVLVVGGGNAAADCALGLAGVAASVGLSYRRAELARLRRCGRSGTNPLDPLALLRFAARCAALPQTLPSSSSGTQYSSSR